MPKRSVEFVKVIVNKFYWLAVTLNLNENKKTMQSQGLHFTENRLYTAYYIFQIKVKTNNTYHPEKECLDQPKQINQNHPKHRFKIQCDTDLLSKKVKSKVT